MAAGASLPAPAVLEPARPFGQSSPEACGPSSFPLGTGLGRNVVIAPKVDSQPGPIGAYLTVDGADQPRQSTSALSGGLITLSP